MNNTDVQKAWEKILLNSVYGGTPDMAKKMPPRPSPSGEVTMLTRFFYYDDKEYRPVSHNAHTVFDAKISTTVQMKAGKTLSLILSKHGAGISK